MITDSILTSFKAYLHDISGHNVHIGDDDLGGTDLPAWTITLEEDIKLTFLTVKSMDALINVKCTLFVDRKRTDDALKIIFKTLLRINQFDEASGSGIGSDQKEQGEDATISTEITENNIILSFPYRLKTIIHDEE